MIGVSDNRTEEDAEVSSSARTGREIINVRPWLATILGRTTAWKRWQILFGVRNFGKVERNNLEAMDANNESRTERDGGKKGRDEIS